ncbi:tetratricopeptide repeat protein [Geobacter sp. FeAm09]|uniref:tetratricopeptide repeat protein n=1 Tax=Geobacter sp. FeAm09 TaxID=2597769 RepID=UPI0011EE1F87|nr:tetratricopeptide repeat protein [Geobacter sp. FeAm09]QEM69756.1 tetratricopeptide repeat protein [Geobacter sp. FeAm09]
MLKSRPEDTEILASLAAIGVKTGRIQEAEIFLDRILTLEPGNREARALLDDLRRGEAASAPAPSCTQEAPAAQLDAVLQGLRQSISRLAAPARSPEERYREAVLHAEQGMVAEAVQELEELVKAAPDHAVAYNDLGVLYYRLGDPGRSLSAHEQAVRLEPRNPTFRKNLANLYYSALGRTDEAIHCFTEVLRDYPQDVEALLALAQISAVNNLGEQAKVFVSKALELEPWNKDAREFLELIT